MATSRSSRDGGEGLREASAPAVPTLDHAEIFALPTSRTYGGRPNRGRNQLRGRQATEAARRYLDGALGDGCWHELDGLRIIAWSQGIPRAAFERVLATLELDREPDRWHVRLLPAIDRSALPRSERAIVAELEALAGGWPP
jgi:hypothetical protein